MNAILKDQYQLLKKLSLVKVLNVLRLFISFYYSRLTKKTTLGAMPMGLSIEPTTSCNLRCSECPSGLRLFSRPTGMLSPETFRQVIDEVKNKLIWLTFYFQGEPYLNRNFLNMVKYAHEKGLYTMTSTNAHYLTDQVARETIESGLSRIIISMDGVSQETYEQYRKGGSLDQVKQGIANLVKWKKELKSSTPHIVLQFIVFGHNEHEIDQVKQVGRELGVDEVKIKSAQIYDFNNEALLPKDENYSRYHKKNGQYSIKNELMNHCWRMWSSAVITWDGKVIPCCFDKDAHHQLGNVQTHKLKEIWLSHPYHRFRNQVLINRKAVDICTNCTEGAEVWI
jgi:radical SAM protein with 4Fe4S-binding SPASM domain